MLDKDLILLVYEGGKKQVLGDYIRIKKISEILIRAGIYVLNIQVPAINRHYLLTLNGLKNTFLNFNFSNKLNIPLSFNCKSIFRYLEFNVSLNFLIRVLRKFKPRVILGEGSTVGYVISIAAKKFSIPCIVDIHGLAFAEEKGKGYENWQELMEIEKRVFQTCDHLIVVSKRMKKYVSKIFGVTDKKIIVASNGSDIRGSFAKYKIPLKIIYAGTFSYWEKVNDFLNIAKEANSRLFKFYLAGEGPLKASLIKRIKREKIPIKYLGYIPAQDIHKLLVRMQIGIAPSTKDLARQVASPIKVFDYMASGLPVITPRVGDWGDIIEIEDCGIALNNDDIENYLNALYILAQESIWTNKSKNAIKCIKEKYNWIKVLEPLTSIILEYVKS